jgi:hypothetical protein|tara:strand:- start:91 stop:564 length:474 start_codon:yes stop_codon:yes gene_type:complete
MRLIFLPVFFLNTAIAIKFCANKYLPSGSCPSNAVDICAVGGNYCLKSGWQYSVTGVSGCEPFQTGGLHGTKCFPIPNVETENDSPSCYPVNRNYCECKECETESDCGTIRGVAAGCTGNATGFGDSYADGFAAGKACGIDNCANALKTAYGQLNQC